MSYTKQNFIKGQILKADHLNAMEAGIEANDIAINSLNEDRVNVMSPPYGYAAAVNDGAVDTSAEIQAMLDEYDYVYLPRGQYLIETPLTLTGKKHIEIDGDIIVESDAGIIITGQDNIVDGIGCIRIKYMTDNASAIRCIATSSGLVNNRITVSRIEYPADELNNNIGIEVTGTETYGYGCFNHFETYIKYMGYGIYAHESEGQNSDSWVTAHHINCDIDQCERGIWLEWLGDGSIITGNIQPKTSNLDDEIHSNHDPITKIGTGTYCHHKTWDFHAAKNKYAYEVLGEYVTVNEYLPEDAFLIIPELKRSFIYRKPFSSNNLTMSSSESCENEKFTNLNDIMYYCHGDKGLHLTIEPQSSINEGLHSLFTGKNQKVFLYGNGEYGTERTFTLEFDEPQSPRNVIVFGSILPENIKVEFAHVDTPDIFVEVGNVTKNIDYIDNNNRDMPVIIPTDITGHGFGWRFENKVKKLKVTITLKNDGTCYELFRIAACVPTVNYMRRTGGYFEGDVMFLNNKGIVLVSPDGKWHRLAVKNDGTVYGDPLW